MKNKNFLLGFLGGTQQSIKGKNTNASSKIIKSNLASKQGKQVNDKQPLSEQKKILAGKQRKSAAIKEIQKLQKQLQNANENIEQTHKKIDTDLFLKKEKQKRQQYAKNLNEDYEMQKKKRQQVLYKKFRGEKQDEENKLNGFQQTKNIKTGVPLQIIKVLQMENKSISKSKSIVSGHHYTLEMIKDDQRMISYDQISSEEKELLLRSDIDTENTSISIMSIKAIAQNMLNVQYFPIDFSKNGLQPIEQYENLMSSLTLMPEFLCNKYYAVKQIDGNTYFLCKMFWNGQKKTIITSDLIETRQFSHYHINLHSKMTDNRNFGPTIVQKCFRKVSANLQYPSIAFSLYSLFGVDAEMIKISNRNYVKENFQSVLKFLLLSGQIVGFMNQNAHNSTIYQNRIYKLTQILQTVQLTPTQLKAKEKKAKRHDKNVPSSQQPTSGQKLKKVIYHLENPYKGLLLDPKGLNKFELLEVFQKFNRLVLIRDYPRGWSCKRINLQVFSLGPMSMTNNQWTKNNQYHFTITTPTNLKVIMRKVENSNAQSIVKRQSTKEQDYETNSLYGFLIFVCKQGQQKISCMKLDSLLVKTKSNDSLQWPSYGQKFEKGRYIIIPYSNKITKTNYQFFNLDFFAQKMENVQFGKAIINEWKWVRPNVQNQGEKIIQSLESKQYIQKVKAQDIQIPKVSPIGTNSQKLLERIQKSGLSMPKNQTLKDLLIPGMAAKFLINLDIQIKENPKKTLSRKKPQETTITKNSQVESLQKQEALQILLGYDILQGEEINRGLMMEQMEKNEEVYDFQDYGLGSDGLTAIMETLMSASSIRKLNLAGNSLDDSGIVFLCYYLEKANRVELQELNVKNNNFGKIGMEAIKGIMQRFNNLHVIH